MEQVVFSRILFILLAMKFMVSCTDKNPEGISPKVEDKERSTPTTPVTTPDPISQKVDQFLKDNEEIFQLITDKTANTYAKSMIRLIMNEKLKTEGELTETKNELRETMKNYTNIKLALNSLNNTANTLKKERNTLKTYIDLSEMADDFFQDCWPRWAGPPPKKPYHDNDWKMLFLNIDNPKVEKLKLKLIEYKIPEDKFGSSVSKLIDIRNTEAHAEIAPDERSEIYTELLKNMHDKTKKFIIEFIAFPDLLENEKLDTQQTVIENVRTERSRTYRLLRIPQYKEYSDQEGQLEHEFRKFKERNPADYREPIAIFKGTRHGAFILFHDFADAFKAWSNKNNFSLTPEQQDSMVIETFPNKDLKKDLYVIKVTGEDIKKRDTCQKIYEKLVDLKKPLQCKQSNANEFLIFVFGNFTDTIITYQKYKNVMVDEKKITVEGLPALPNISNLRDCEPVTDTLPSEEKNEHK